MIVVNEEIIEKYRREFNEKYKPVMAENTNTVRGSSESDGGLIVIVTTFRGLYPVENAKVNVFTGIIENPNIVDTDTTGLSGKTKKFVLKTQDKSLSEKAGENKTPFTTYNISVNADGYVEQVNMDIPVFEGITTLQKVNLTSKGAYIGNGPIIVYERPGYNL